MLRILKFSPFLLLLACAKTADSATTTAATATTTQTCRTYATNITDTTNSITYNCTYNGTTTVSCTNGGAETITYTYPNLQTFVDEAAAPLSVFNRNRASQLVIASATAANQINLTRTFNGGGQVTSATAVAATYTVSYTYTAWDTNNRPTAGTAQFTAGLTCTGRVLAISNVDGVTRTQTTTASAGTGANCAVLNVPVSQMDANGNPLQALSRSFTTNATTTACY